MPKEPSRSPFQNNLPSDEAAEVQPVRRLQSPAERFRAGQIGRDTTPHTGETSPFDAELGEPYGAESESPRDAMHAAEFEAPRAMALDPFEHLPRTESARRAKGGGETRRARRRLKQHAPHYHEKNSGIVAHKALSSAPDAEPQNEWDRAAQNSTARAALARKKSQIRRIMGRVVLASSVLGLVWAGATALTAPQFNVNRIEVEGVAQTPVQSVEKLTGALIGQNVFRASRARVESRVEALPTVRSARLRRAWSWPPHMKLVVTERQPIIQVGSGTTWWVADAQGVAFRRADRKDARLNQLTSPQLQPATGKALPAAQWKRARQLEAALSADNAIATRENGGPGGGKFWDLRRVYLDENSAAALRISGKGALREHGELLVRLGEEGWPEKLKQARTALAYFERTGREASELDLVSGEHPRWLPKEPIVVAKATDVAVG